MLTRRKVPTCSIDERKCFRACRIDILLSCLGILSGTERSLPLATILASPFTNLATTRLSIVHLTCPGRLFCRTMRKFFDLDLRRVPRAISRGRTVRMRRGLEGFFRMLSHFERVLPCATVRSLLTGVVSGANCKLFVDTVPKNTRERTGMRVLIRGTETFRKADCGNLFGFMHCVRRLGGCSISCNRTDVVSRRSSAIHVVDVRGDGNLRFPVIFMTKAKGRFGARSLGKDVIVRPEGKIKVSIMSLRVEAGTPAFLGGVVRRGAGLRGLTRRLHILCMTVAETGRGLVLANDLGVKRSNLRPCIGRVASEGSPLDLCRLRDTGHCLS